MTAFCLAMTWACHIKAMDITLMVKMQSARTRPIWVSEAGTWKTRLIQDIGEYS
jgi:hypothetical protein